MFIVVSCLIPASNRASAPADRDRAARARYDPEVMRSASSKTWRELRAILAGRQAPPDVVPQAMVEAAHAGGVLALLASLAPSVASSLGAELEELIVLQMHIEQAEGQVADILSEGGIERAALMKGNATRRLLYDEPYHRPGRDVDVLVEADDFRKVLGLLKAAGWRDAVPLPTVRLGGADPYAWSFARGFGQVQLECDVHQRLTIQPGNGLCPSSLLDRAEPHAQSPLRLLHPDDLLLSGALHLAKTGFDGPLKSWIDLLRLLDHPDLDLGRCAQRATAASMATITWATLRVLETWFEGSVPPDVLSRLRPSQPRAALLERCLSGDRSMARRWPRTRRGGYLIPGPLLMDDPRRAISWCGWRVSSLVRSRLGRQQVMPGS